MAEPKKRKQRELKNNKKFDDYSDGEFKHQFYYSKKVVQIAYNKISQHAKKNKICFVKTNGKTIYKNVELSERHFLSTITYLREGISFRLLSRIFGLSTKTLMNDVWATLSCMKDFHPQGNILEKYNHEVRDLVNGGDSIITMAVDTFFCPISMKNDEFYNKKYHGKGVKYQLAVGFNDGKILYSRPNMNTPSPKYIF